MNGYIGDRIKAVFFDHDDTLVGTIGPKWDEHKYVARRYYGVELTDDCIIEHWGKPLDELVCILYGTDDAVQAIAYTQDHHREYPKTLFPYTIPVLHRLHEAGKVLGIITATKRFSLDYDFDLLGIPRCLIDYIQTADDTSYHKPDPRVFAPAVVWLAERGIEPSEVLYVADGLHDMNAAIGAGFNFLGVETGLVTAAQFAAAGAASVAALVSLMET